MIRFEERFCRSKDGLDLYYRDYEGPAGRTPVLCIPGLTRNAKDFDFIAARIAATRRVIATDLRGRGRSGYDADSRNYAVPVETTDMLHLIESLEIPRAIVLGTSRGGVIAMTMAALKPDAVAGAILNDMGAQLEPEGLERIYDALRVPPRFSGWEEAAAALERNHAARFAHVDAERWRQFARALYRERGGAIVGDYDPAFPQAILDGRGTNPRTDKGAADLWKWFAGLAAIPTLVLRGENSDLLSGETVTRMKAAKPDLIAVTVRDRGHVPFLDEPEAVAAIDEFLAAVP